MLYVSCVLSCRCACNLSDSFFVNFCLGPGGIRMSSVIVVSERELCWQKEVLSLLWLSS